MSISLRHLEDCRTNFGVIPRKGEEVRWYDQFLSVFAQGLITGA